MSLNVILVLYIHTESQSRGQVNGNSDGCEQRETEPSDPVFHQAHHLQTASNTIQGKILSKHMHTPQNRDIWCQG